MLRNTHIPVRAHTHRLVCARQTDADAGDLPVNGRSDDDVEEKEEQDEEQGSAGGA